MPPQRDTAQEDGSMCTSSHAPIISHQSSHTIVGGRHAFRSEWPSVAFYDDDDDDTDDDDDDDYYARNPKSPGGPGSGAAAGIRA